MKNQDVPILKKEYKVLVKCYTYNQAPFIAKALQGFAMQLTSFPFVCVIMDDCSSDGERNVLEKYISDHCNVVETYDDETVHVVIALSIYNNNCTFAFYFLKENLYKKRERKWEYIKPWQERCQYEAFCEGDDYWLSPTKLEDQARFLDVHEDYMLVGSNGIIAYTDPGLEIRYFNNCFTTREVSFEELVERWFFPTASLFYRVTLCDVYPVWHNELHYCDDVIVMTCAIHGKVACLGDATCVYRKGCGITSDLDKQQIYMQQQHLLFYNHLLEDTGDKYAECLEKKIRIIQKKLSYYETRNKSKLLLFLKFPRTAMKNTILATYPSIKRFFRKLI